MFPFNSKLNAGFILSRGKEETLLVTVMHPLINALYVIVLICFLKGSQLVWICPTLHSWKKYPLNFLFFSPYKKPIKECHCNNIFVAPLWKCKSHTMQSGHLVYNSMFLVYSQSCGIITIINFRTFSLPSTLDPKNLRPVVITVPWSLLPQLLSYSLSS